MTSCPPLLFLKFLFQPDLRPRCPVLVEADIKREVVLPVFHLHPVDVLGNRGVDVTHCGALVKDTGVEPTAVPVPLEQSVNLVVGKPEDILELLDGEDLESHLCNTVKGGRLIPRLLRLLGPGVTGQVQEEPAGVLEVLAGGDDAPVLVPISLEEEEPRMALN